MNQLKIVCFTPCTLTFESLRGNIGVARGHDLPKFLAYLVILSFERQYISQTKQCCLHKIKHFGPPKNYGLATLLCDITSAKIQHFPAILWITRMHTMCQW